MSHLILVYTVCPPVYMNYSLDLALNFADLNFFVCLLALDGLMILKYI